MITEFQLPKIYTSIKIMYNNTAVNKIISDFYINDKLD